ncbi:hypothetical protein T492DRAFT_978402 [Pavlovales sp. CCMP2436]|nr:hypothetical protein T492DRAFT_978402 [Pavlovales sp. CCMP2436]|mmetsp:Transcript_49798/g.114056  ORF Transcript_49798/g.114056 Transcript_49798/m.114056 type:complete len:278 (+) Transcript_49798:244-1077(+)
MRDLLRPTKLLRTGAARCLLRMAEPVAVGLKLGVPIDAGAAVRQRAEDLSRAGMPLDPVEVLTTLQLPDLVSTVLIAYALAVGPGPWVAAIGIGSNIRPTRQVALILARLLGLEKERWAQDVGDGFSFDLPLPIVVTMGAIFGLFGLVTQRLLLLGLDGSTTFVLSLSGSLAVAAWFFELIRPQLESREEYDQRQEQLVEFEAFASAQLERAPGASCHESNVVKSFRAFYPKYRASSGKIDDGEIESMMRRWGVERSPAGYYKGISLKPGVLTSVFK